MKKIGYQVKRSHPGVFIRTTQTAVQAGFPSPADDFKEEGIDLDGLLINNKQSTFLVKVSGDSMLGVGIFPGDRLIVDRSLKPKHNSIVIACIEGEFTVKRLVYKSQSWVLKPENKAYPTIKFRTDDDFIWGVVTYNLRKLA